MSWEYEWIVIVFGLVYFYGLRSFKQSEICHKAVFIIGFVMVRIAKNRSTNRKCKTYGKQ